MVKTIKAQVLLLTGLNDFPTSASDLEDKVCQTILDAYEAGVPVFTFPAYEHYSKHLLGIIETNKILKDHFTGNEDDVDKIHSYLEYFTGNEDDIDKIHSYLECYYWENEGSYRTSGLNVRVGGSTFAYRGKWNSDFLALKNQDPVLEVWEACVPHICCLGNSSEEDFRFFVDPSITHCIQSLPFNRGERTEIPKNSLYKYFAKIGSENVFQRLDDVKFSF